MWTYIPTGGYDDVPLMEEGGVGLYVGIVVPYLLCLLGLVAYLYRYRHSPAYMNRCVNLSLLAIPAYVVSIPYFLLRPLLGPKHMSCHVDNWMLALFAIPMSIVSLARMLRILHISHLQQALLEVANMKSPNFGTEHFIPLASKSWESGMEKRPIPDLTLPKAMTGQWWYRYRALLTERALIYIVIGTQCFVYIILAILTAIRGDYPDLPYDLGQCFLDWPNWCIITTAWIAKGAYLPLSYRFMRGLKDAYGMVRETKQYAIAGPILSVISFAVLIPVNISKTVRVTILLTASMIYSLNGIYATYILPLCDILRAERRSRTITYSVEGFDALLHDSDGFRDFLLFSLRDFSIENPLFYRRYHTIAQLHQDMERTSRESMDSGVLDNGRLQREKMRKEMRAELRSVYATFVRENAQYQLNLPTSLVTEMHDRIKECDFSFTILEPIYREVHQLMFQNTYPRFMEWFQVRARQSGHSVHSSMAPV